MYKLITISLAAIVLHVLRRSLLFEHHNKIVSRPFQLSCYDLQHEIQTRGVNYFKVRAFFIEFLHEPKSV